MFVRSLKAGRKDSSTLTVLPAFFLRRISSFTSPVRRRYLPAHIHSQILSNTNTLTHTHSHERTHSLTHSHSQIIFTARPSVRRARPHCPPWQLEEVQRQRQQVARPQLARATPARAGSEALGLQARRGPRASRGPATAPSNRTQLRSRGLSGERRGARCAQAGRHLLSVTRGWVRVKGCQ